MLWPTTRDFYICDMHIKESRTKKFGYCIILLFILTFICGGLGSAFPDESTWQTLFWHVSTTSMIAACVLNGAYITERGWSFASGGFYLLGVANGVFFASLNVDHYSPLTLARGILVLIPAFIAIGMSNYFQPWLKWLSVFTGVPFLILYIRILTGGSYEHDFYEIAAFFFLNVMGLVWSYNIWKELNSETPPQ